MLLFPDPRPLVERLGTEFFRTIPQEPGVYLMRDRAGIVVYVGKAKNLRKRLANYRVANPERMRNRHLRLLHTVERIEVQICGSESAALAKESALLRSLRPRFNRAGTWPGKPKWVGCRCSEMSFEFSVSDEALPGWDSYGVLGYSAYVLRAALARLLWRALQPEIIGLPCGWSGAPQRTSLCIDWRPSSPDHAESTMSYVQALFRGDVSSFTEWVRQCTSGCIHPFEIITRDLDLEDVAKLVGNKHFPLTEAGISGATEGRHLQGSVDP
jgi:predicted GIY-YIG superfamily endonuclease